MKTLKSKIVHEEQRVGKRSHGKKGRKKFPFSSREIASIENSPRVVRKKLRRSKSRIRLELFKIELAKLRVAIRNSAESLMAANREANQIEAEFAVLTTRRNELMDNLMEMKATEAFWMHRLGFL